MSPNKALAHLVPSGSPLALMPFMVLVERVRILIRPLTLSVRLMANIVKESSFSDESSGGTRLFVYFRISSCYGTGVCIYNISYFIRKGSVYN